MDAAIAAYGCHERRVRKLPAHVVDYLLIALCLYPDDDYEEVAEKLTSMLASMPGARWEAPTRGAITQARQRLGPEAVREVFRQMARPAATESTSDMPATAWTPAYDAERRVRPGAWVAELTGLLDLTGWPKGMRVIVRKERPHPGARLRLTDLDGHRIAYFVTDAQHGQPADLELRHRRRARAEDRIRCAKDTDLANLHDFAQNQIWLEIVALACELLAWMQMLALRGTAARRYEPKTPAPAAVRRGRTAGTRRRRLRLRIAARWPWAHDILTALTRLQALPAPP
ncbi:transposase [Nonomuraea turcica]|uniref:transposase n=1 Tax=Nonomuraea sp. G32 TaxID=3067274 RepID=UPI0035302225